MVGWGLAQYIQGWQHIQRCLPVIARKGSMLRRVCETLSPRSRSTLRVYCKLPTVLTHHPWTFRVWAQISMLLSLSLPGQCSPSTQTLKGHCGPEGEDGRMSLCDGDAAEGTQLGPCWQTSVCNYRPPKGTILTAWICELKTRLPSHPHATL